MNRSRDWPCGCSGKESRSGRRMCHAALDHEGLHPNFEEPSISPYYIPTSNAAYIPTSNVPTGSYSGSSDRKYPENHRISCRKWPELYSSRHLNVSYHRVCRKGKSTPDKIFCGPSEIPTLPVDGVIGAGLGELQGLGGYAHTINQKINGISLQLHPNFEPVFHEAFTRSNLWKIREVAASYISTSNRAVPARHETFEVGM